MFSSPGTFIDHPPIPRAASKPQKALTQRVPSGRSDFFLSSTWLPELVGGTYPSEKYYILSWNYPSQYMEK